MAEGESTAPFVFLFGLLLFAGSLVAFVADLVTGYDVVRSLVANAVAVLVLVWWAARDTLRDPDSAVATRGGAAGTGLLLVGLYLAVAAVAVAATSPFHGRLELAIWGSGLGIGVVAVGYLVYPRGAVVERADERANQEAEATTDAADAGEK